MIRCTVRYPSLLSAGLVPVPALAQQQAESILSVSRLVEFAVALAAVLAFIYAIAWLVRRMQQGTGEEGSLRILQGLQVGTKERLLLVDIRGRTILVGVSPGGMSTLLELDDPRGGAVMESVS